MSPSDDTPESGQADADTPDATPFGPPDPAGFDPTAPEPDGPTRRCLVSRSVRPKEDLLRFVISPDGDLTPDMDGRLPGRGFWLSPAPNVIEKARKKGVFGRAAHRTVCVPQDFQDRVESLLEDRCLRLIGLARKAGQAVVGFEKVKGLVQTNRTAYVLEAFDGAENAHKKLNAEAYGARVFRTLDRDALARAFGRDNAVHAAILPGGLSVRLETDLVRLSRLRGRNLDESALEQAPAPSRGPRSRRGGP